MDGTVLAHGLGGAKDLPIPVDMAVAGAVAALVISFSVLALAWRTPRYDASRGGLPLTVPPAATALSWVLRALGMAFFLYVAMAAVLGEDTLVNPVFGSFYVLLWVGIVPASLLFGPFFKAVSPARTLAMLVAKLTGAPADRGLLPYPERLGYWPAALTLFAFVWMELVFPHATQLGPVRLWFALYLGTMLIGSAVYGTTFLARADPFEVYSTLVGRLSVWGRREGRLVVRSPLANLDATPVRPGLVAVVGVLLGSTAYDSFRESPTWLRVVQSLGIERVWPDTAALVVFTAGVTLVFAAATVATGVSDHQARRHLPDLFAHSVVPIIVGYMVAHYVNFFVEFGQRTLIDLSDPLTTGADYLGTGDWQINYWLSMHPTVLASIKVLAIVTGHVLGVVAAHDRAMKLLPRKHQLVGQLPLLFVMVGFTAGGLYLLFAS